MNQHTYKRTHRITRHRRTRALVSGTADRPRVTVFRSNQHVFVQLIDDTSGKTLVSNERAATQKGKQKKTDRAMAVGEALGKKAIEKGIKKVVFDKSGFAYHGRVKAIADGLRKAGLEL